MNKSDLEIILITFNRKYYLERTLNQLLADTSPVKDFPITVLDNCSNDGTTEYLKELIIEHPNIRHIIHNRNIGGNANIARAFELSSKKYFWILADDDDYDFTHWNEVEKATQKEAGLIIVNTQYSNSQKELFKMFRRLTFLPACIYRSDLLTDLTMRNVYDNISSWFPHLAVICSAVNRNVPIYICNSNIVVQNHKNNDGYISQRKNEDLMPTTRYQFFDIGYLNSLEMIKNKKQRALAVKWFTHKPNFFNSIRSIYKTNVLQCNSYSRNITSIWTVLSTWQRIQFLIGIFLETFFYLLKYPKYYLRKKRNKKI